MSALHDQELADTLEDLDMRGRFVTTEREQKLRLKVAALQRQLRRVRDRNAFLEATSRMPPPNRGHCCLCGSPAKRDLCHAHSDLAA